MRRVVALGGNALLRCGQPPRAHKQLDRLRRAAAELAGVAARHDLVLSHGKGPQVGLLALQAAACVKVEAHPLDVLGLQAIRCVFEHGGLVIAADVAAVFPDRGRPTQRAIGKVTPQALAGHNFAAASMGPKVGSARSFEPATGPRAVIGALDRIEEMVAGTAGGQVRPAAAGGAASL